MAFGNAASSFHRFKPLPPSQFTSSTLCICMSTLQHVCSDITTHPHRCFRLKAPVHNVVRYGEMWRVSRKSYAFHKHQRKQQLLSLRAYCNVHSITSAWAQILYQFLRRELFCREEFFNHVHKEAWVINWHLDADREEGSAEGKKSHEKIPGSDLEGSWGKPHH